MKTLTSQAIDKMYGYKSTIVLSIKEFIKALPRNRGARQKWEILKDLPSKEDYVILHREVFTITVAELISNAFEEIGSLAEEMRSWYDNLPEGLQNADKGQQIDEIAGKLENCSEPYYPDMNEDIRTVYVSGENNSRRERASEVADQLIAAIAAINFYIQEEKEEDICDELEGLVSELDSVVDEVESIDFPGMYG